MTIIILITVIIMPHFVLAKKCQDKIGPWKSDGLLSYLYVYTNPY